MSNELDSDQLLRDLRLLNSASDDFEFALAECVRTGRVLVTLDEQGRLVYSLAPKN